MRLSIVLALGIGAALAACAPQKAENAPVQEVPADGQGYLMASIIGIGNIVLTPDAMITSDGQQLPIRKVGDGVFQFRDPPSVLTNGQDFCFSKPVTYFTWHRHDEGLWVMNVGDWQSPPSPPPSDDWDVDGACGLSTYRAG